MAASEPCSLASLHGPCFLMNAQPALAPRRKRHLLHHLDPDPGRPDDDEAVRERALGQPSRDGAGPPEIVGPPPARAAWACGRGARAAAAQSAR